MAIINWTLNDLSAAMRGMPRDALIRVRLPDGRLTDLQYVRPGYFGSDGTDQSASARGRYTIVLEARDPDQ